MARLASHKTRHAQYGASGTTAGKALGETAESWAATSIGMATFPGYMPGRNVRVRLDIAAGAYKPVSPALGLC